LSLWGGAHGAPQRKSRLYTALVEEGLASLVSGALLPTVDPYLYTLAFTAADGVPLDLIEEVAHAEIERIMRMGVTPDEMARARRQLRAQLVFESDGVTSVAHQLGYFETIAAPQYIEGIEAAIASVTVDQVAAVARDRLRPASRTVGWFRPTSRRP
jgi:zinc protease